MNLGRPIGQNGYNTYGDIGIFDWTKAGDRVLDHKEGGK